jgi:hypothetical protein
MASMTVAKKVAKALSWMSTYSIPADNPAIKGCPILFSRKGKGARKRLTATDGRMLVDVEFPKNDAEQDVEPFTLAIGREAWETAANECLKILVITGDSADDLRLESRANRPGIPNDLSREREVSLETVDNSFRAPADADYRSIHVDAVRLRDLLHMVVNCIGRDAYDIPVTVELSVPADNRRPILVSSCGEPNAVRAAIMPRKLPA